MPFMLKIQWDIKAGREAEFRVNQAALCKVMLEHPGVICYHVDYPSQRVSQWTEIYATDEAFAAHLANDKGKGPLATVIDACDKITCQCRRNPNAGSKQLRFWADLPRARRLRWRGRRCMRGSSSATFSSRRTI